jgi:hypothetical protein
VRRLRVKDPIPGDVYGATLTSQCVSVLRNLPLPQAMFMKLKVADYRCLEERSASKRDTIPKGAILKNVAE